MRIATLMVFVFVSATACSKKSAEPVHAGSSGSSGGGAPSASTGEMHIPLLNRVSGLEDADHLPPEPIYVVYRNKIFYSIGRDIDLIVSPDGRPRIATEEAKESGHWEEKFTHPLPSGTPTTPAELAAAVEDERGVLILADETTPISEIVPAMKAAFGPAKKCWWLGVKFGAVAVDPCGRTPVTDEQVELSLTIAGAKGSLTISKVGETTPFSTLADLDAKLREQKASAFFADRTDLAITSTDAATIGDLVKLLAQLHAAGFTSAYLAH